MPWPPRTIGRLRPVRPFRRRVLVVIAATVVVLLALTVTADLIVGRQLRSRMVSALSCAGGTDLDVRIDGPPVLFQLARRELDTVTVSGVSTDLLGSAEAAKTLADSPLTLELHGVGLQKPPSVTSAQVSTVLSFAVLQQKLGENAATAGLGLSGTDVTIAADGDQLALTTPKTLLGQPLQVLLGVEVQPDGLRITPTALKVGDRSIRADLLSGPLGGLIGGGLGDGLGDGSGADLLTARTVKLPLPDGVRLTSATVQPGGLAVSLAVDPTRLKQRTGACSAASSPATR